MNSGRIPSETTIQLQKGALQRVLVTSANMPRMAGTEDDPGAMARAALDAFKKQRKETEDRESVLINATTLMSGAEDEYRAKHLEITMKAALLNAHSNRELAMAVIAATEILDSSVRSLDERFTKLNAGLAESSAKAEEGAKQLSRFNTVLAFLTAGLLITAFAQAWFTYVAAPVQVMQLPPSPLTQPAPSVTIQPVIVQPRR